MKPIRDIIAPIVSRAIDKRKRPPAPAKVESFDFEAHPDPRTTPRPRWVVPEELRLPTDDLP